MLLWVKTLKRRIETSGYGGRPISGVDLKPVKYGTLFGPFFKFQNSQHCTVYDKILKNRLIRELARARAHLFVNGLYTVYSTPTRVSEWGLSLSTLSDYT